MSLCQFCARQAVPSAPSSSRSYASRSATSLWKSRTHRKEAPRIPNPMPAIYPQRVILSDGSTFTSYTTAPAPSILRLTRDVTNNPLWNPASEGRRGGGEEEGKRLARFKARFGGSVPSGEDNSSQQSGMYEVGDLDWLSGEAGEQVKISAKEMAGPQKAAKGKKK